jgi:hypothetical protein
VQLEPQHITMHPSLMTHMMQCTLPLVWSLKTILLYLFCQLHPHSDLWIRLLLLLIQVLLRSPVDMRRSWDDNVEQMITTILMTGPESACVNKLVMLSHYFARCRCICASLVLSHLPKCLFHSNRLLLLHHIL